MRAKKASTFPVQRLPDVKVGKDSGTYRIHYVTPVKKRQALEEKIRPPRTRIPTAGHRRERKRMPIHPQHKGGSGTQSSVFLATISPLFQRMKKFSSPLAP